MITTRAMPAPSPGPHRRVATPTSRRQNDFADPLRPPLATGPIWSAAPKPSRHADRTAPATHHPGGAARPRATPSASPPAAQMSDWARSSTRVRPEENVPSGVEVRHPMGWGGSGVLSVLLVVVAPDGLLVVGGSWRPESHPPGPSGTEPPNRERPGSSIRLPRGSGCGAGFGEAEVLAGSPFGVQGGGGPVFGAAAGVEGPGPAFPVQHLMVIAA